MSDPVSINTTPKPPEVSVPQSGLGAPAINLPEAVKIGLAILATVGGVVLTLPSMGIALPPVALAIAGGVVALAAALGVVSPGARKKE